MAKILYICARKSQAPEMTQGELINLARRLTPDHISPSLKTIRENEGITLSIISPNEAVMVHGSSVAVGNIEADSKDWWRPGAEVPDGAYALFRGNNERIEVATDIVASRSIWYVHTEKLFISSTSQRAIIGCLGSYEPNPKVYPWVLSSGSLGPDLSWDRRIKKMNPDSRLVLDRQSWKLTEHTKRAVFEPLSVSEEELETQLKDRIKITFQRLNLDWKHWVLALSGGYDSRCCLVMLDDRPQIKCISWGVSSSLSDPSSDAYIARQLALKRGLSHEHFATDIFDEPIDRMFDRILMACEGRIDHIRASMDGLARYKQIRERGILGLIRGDEAFGWHPVTSKVSVRWSVGLKMLEDYSNASILCLDQLVPQELPTYLHRRRRESLATWRDRLFQEFHIPCVLAALSEARLSYIEQANPLISRRVIHSVRTLPDHLRTDKALFKKIVHHLAPTVPIATKDSVAPLHKLLTRMDINDLFQDELRTRQAKALLPSGILDYALNCQPKAGLGGSAASRLLSSKSLQVLRAPARQVFGFAVRRLRKPSLNPQQLALRCFIISRMHRILHEDARCCAGNKQPRPKDVGF